MVKLIQIKIIDNRAYKYFSFLRYATPGSAGLDLPACLDSSLIMYPGENYLISTGIAIYIADVGIAGIILPRSGLGHKYGIILGNVIGLIDSDYQGELMISLWNRSQKEFVVRPGQRVAQLIFISVIQIKFSMVSSFDPSVRGSKGFGHSM